MGKKADKNVGGASPKGASVVNVVDADGVLIRSYSKADHGSDFKKLAEEFASKVEGRKVVAVKGSASDEDEE